MARQALKSRWFPKFYVWLFAGYENQSANNVVMKLSLRAAGFNPTDRNTANGEAIVAEALVRIGCRTALDIGANVGHYSLLLKQAGFDRIDAFEPHPASYQGLENRAKLSDGAVVAHQLALGDSKRRGLLGFDRDALLLASLSSEATNVPYVEFSEVVEVEVSTIDDFCETGRAVDFVKIDTEGFELQVLVGGRKLFATLPPVAVQLEFNHHHLFTGDTLWRLHSELGDRYRAYRLLTNRHGIVEVDTSSPYANVFLFSNYIFVRQDMVEQFKGAMDSVT